MNALLRISLLVIASSSCAFGQVQPPALAKPVPPPGPLIQKHAPDFSTWSITLSATGFQLTSSAPPAAPPAANTPPVPPSRVITKTGKIIHVALTDPQGRSWNLWSHNSQVVIVSAEGKAIGFAFKSVANTQIINPLYFDFTASDFQDFDWISAANYVGIQSVSGKSCLVFRTLASLPGGTKITIAAAVDLQSRLPVRLEDSHGVTSYTFGPPPTESLILPDDVNQFILRQARHDNSLAPGKGPAF